MTVVEEPQAGSHQRIDKWLFFTRMVKSRTLAQMLVAQGAVSVNGTSIDQPSHLVRPGDEVELRLERRDVHLVVQGGGSRRGPYAEARQLSQDVSPESEPKRLTPFERAQRRPRPIGGSSGS